MKNILITGIHGFVGSNFVEALKDNHTIYGLDIIFPEKEGVEKTFSWNELNKTPKTNAIIHLAGKAHDTKDESLAQSYFDINTELTKKIFDYFLQSDAEAFIFFSSVKAAADVVESNFLTEDVEPKPVGAYGESKIKAEEYIQSKDWSGKKVYILRPAMIYGVGNKGNLNLLYNLVKKGIPWFLGAFENNRSFCSINNISYVAAQLIQKQDIPSGIYHIADDEALSTNELIELICESVGKKPRIWYTPKKMVNTMAAIGTALRLPLNIFRLQKLTENYVVSNEKIKQALHISKMPFSAKEEFINTFKSFQ